MLDMPSMHEEYQEVMPQAFVKPSEQDLLLYAKEIQTIFSDGFQWSDLISMLKLTFHHLKDYPDLSREEHERCMITVLNHVIDLTDTPYLPDSYSDPIFKALIPPFASLILEGNYHAEEFLEDAPNHQMIITFAEQQAKLFEDGVQWHDLSDMIRNTIQFADQFLNLDKTEKIRVSQNAVALILEKTDTPYLPDTFSDPVFQWVSNVFIEMIFDSM